MSRFSDALLHLATVADAQATLEKRALTPEQQQANRERHMERAARANAWEREVIEVIRTHDKQAGSEVLTDKVKDLSDEERKELLKGFEALEVIARTARLTLTIGVNGGLA